MLTCRAGAQLGPTAATPPIRPVLTCAEHVDPVLAVTTADSDPFVARDHRPAIAHRLRRFRAGVRTDVR